MAKKKEKLVKPESKWDGTALSFWGVVAIMALVFGALTAAGAFIAYKLGSFETFGNGTPWYQDLFPMIGNSTPLMEELGLFKVTAKILAGFVAIAAFAALGVCISIIIYVGWDMKHTVISGQRMQFKGNVFGLVLNAIKWAFLTVVTVGIYLIWFPAKLKAWKVKNTVSAVEEDEYGWAAPEINYYEYD